MISYLPLKVMATKMRNNAAIHTPRIEDAILLINVMFMNEGNLTEHSLNTNYYYEKYSKFSYE
jgi:hypothetical protein